MLQGNGSSTLARASPPALHPLPHQATPAPPSQPTKHPAWLLFDGTGEFIGVVGRSVRIDTAEQAHRKFTPRAKDRARELADGYTIRREEPGELDPLLAAWSAAVDREHSR
ncbi:hypothetical protein GS531_25000 [Rhodococcus hoagii]|nr:hypothetical protein [Prescottella equi]